MQYNGSEMLYRDISENVPLLNNEGNFYILLTVQLGQILVNEQLDAQFFFIHLLQISTCFERSCAHRQEN
jgi:hypothetical protein